MGSVLSKAGIHCKKIFVGTEIEYCVFEIENSVETVVICIVYRNEKFRLPPFLSEFEELLYDLKAFNKNTILFGDFNTDTLKDSTDKINMSQGLLPIISRSEITSNSPHE